MWLEGVAIIFLIAFGAWCISRVRDDYRQEPRLAASTLAALVILYSVHFLIVVAAAANSRWQLPIDRTDGVVLGTFLLIAGAVIYVGAVASFRSLARMCGLETSQLVTSGMYRWSRNPQNVGWVLVLGGTALITRSGLVLLLAALFWLSFLLYLPAEERFLERTFGEPYRRYRNQSHRYFGPPRKPGA